MKYILPVFGIEDDKDDAESIVEAFVNEGIHDYYFFPEPGEFFAVFNDKVPVIVIDYNLPGMNGQDVLDKARKINKAVRPILISGIITLEMTARLSVSGAVDFVVKSSRGWEKELAQKVKRQLEFAAEELQESKSFRSEIKSLLKSNGRSI